MNVTARALLAPVVSLLLLLAGPPGLAEDSPTPEAQLTDSISVNYVLVPFVPLDRHGRPLRGLRPRDVRLLVDGAPVMTDLFESSAQAPVSFTILLDGSGSMGLAGKMEGARAALRTLFSRQRPGDEYSLFLCAAGEVTELVPFTPSGQRVLRAFDAVEPFGKTTLFDAVARMPDKSILGSNGSRAIILLTDGLDNASETDRPTLLALLESIDVPVYPLGLVSREQLLPAAGPAAQEARLDLGVLADLARMSGGRLAIASRPEELKDGIETVLSELRAQYLVGFAPSGKGKVRYRRIALDISGPVSAVRVRSGYRGTDPPLIARKGTFRSR
ncbi:MAG TPA: VWA domain-containing protein [Thermoanaerobaculia bacterium]|nr:VWA domain-containing protein [Thermoanaerobaculia bacterium]